MHSSTRELKQWFKSIFRRRLTVLLLVSLLLATNHTVSLTFQRFPDDFDIDIHPHQPTTEDSIRITLSGVWRNGCVAEYTDHFVRNYYIWIRGDGGPDPGIGCGEAISDWSFTVHIGRLGAGEYTVEAQIGWKDNSFPPIEKIVYFEVEGAAASPTPTKTPTSTLTRTPTRRPTPTLTPIPLLPSPTPTGTPTETLTVPVAPTMTLKPRWYSYIPFLSKD